MEEVYTSDGLMNESRIEASLVPRPSSSSRPSVNLETTWPGNEARKEPCIDPTNNFAFLCQWKKDKGWICKEIRVHNDLLAVYIVQLCTCLQFFSDSCS